MASIILFLWDFNNEPSPDQNLNCYGSLKKEGNNTKIMLCHNLSVIAYPFLFTLLKDPISPAFLDGLTFVLLDLWLFV
jgi:hypothetical protein